MVDDTKSPVLPGVVAGIKEPVSMRLPSVFVMLTEDGPDKKGKMREGSVGFKYGNTSKDWLWLDFISMKKIIDMCMVNKILFNKQLERERTALKVSEL